jgi:BON domain
MNSRMKRISAALAFAVAGITTSAMAQEVAKQNQAVADSVVDSLRKSGQFKGSRLDVEASKGVVTLNGTVTSPERKQALTSMILSVPGVTGVVDNVTIAPAKEIKQVQYDVALGGHAGHSGAYSSPVQGAPAPVAPSGYDPNGPAPENGTAGGFGNASGAHAMPNYAWPSQAPYPNFSAVGYPTVYPWQAWPNIGPVHPYPEVPMDWRAVTLRWDDGLWWLDFKKHYTRPFFTPYPFGLFAY